MQNEHADDWEMAFAKTFPSRMSAVEIFYRKIKNISWQALLKNR